VPDAPATTQQTATEPVGTTADRSQSSAPAAPSERPQLASFSDALTRATTDQPADASKGNEKPSTPNGLDGSGASTTPVSKPDASEQPSVVDPTAPEQPDSEVSAEGEQPDASKPEQDVAKGADGKRSRRGSAEIAAVTAERDQLATRVQQLEALTSVPDDVKAAMTTAMLPDDVFGRLDAKKRREDITGDYLTPEESQQYTTALQVRDWFAPMLAHERQQASQWVEGQRKAIFNDQAEALAPVLRERAYLKADTISRAASWTDIYTHLCDAAESHGREAERAELQPKLDERDGRIAELETELTSLRTTTRRGPALERGGVSGGAYSPVPDFKTAKASDLFGAAIQQSEQQRARRPAGAR
jgi:hypothetical protein